MKKRYLLTLALLLPAAAVHGQVPLNIQLQIVKAEDARRFDAELEGLFKHTHYDVRTRAALAAGRIGDDRAIAFLVPMLEKGTMKEREMAAFAIGEIESAAGADALLRALSGSTPGTELAGVRARLLEAAGKIAAANPNDERAKQLGPAVMKALEAELVAAAPAKAVIRLGLTAILRARPAGGDAATRKFLAFSDPDIVADALNTLARLRAKNADRDARDLLETHVHTVVRANAARALGAAEDKEAVELLVKAATTDVDPRVRVSAIRSLASIRDAKAAGPLLKRGDELITAMARKQTPELIPSEKNEFIEIAVALGRLLPNTGNTEALDLIRHFWNMDVGRTAEVYVARLRISTKRGENEMPQLTSWRQYSTLAQMVGEFSVIEPADDEGKRMKAEAPGILKPMAEAFAESDPAKEGELMLAGPDVLRAYARFKTDDLGEILRKALANKDVFIRATAADLIADLPASEENLKALSGSLGIALATDTMYNDATLSVLDAMAKLDKMKAMEAFEVAIGSPDHLVRKRIHDLLKDAAFKNVELPASIKFGNKGQPLSTNSRSAKGNKMGQVINSEADYRAATGRKNGTVSAIVSTRKGTFTIELLPEDAPLTVDNFIRLARTGYFNGREVHRVVPNFVMQDGDPRGDGSGGPGWSIRCEINMHAYGRGMVGMALSGKDTGGSQWFVTHSPQPHLDGGYTIFGRVNETGMKVVDNIVRGDKILSLRIVGR